MKKEMPHPLDVAEDRSNQAWMKWAKKQENSK